MKNEKLKRYAEEFVASIVQKANTILDNRFKSDITLQSDYPQFVNYIFEVRIGVYAFYYDEKGIRNSCKIADIDINAKQEVICTFYIPNKLRWREQFFARHPLYTRRRSYLPFALAAHAYTVCNIFVVPNYIQTYFHTGSITLTFSSEYSYKVSVYKSVGEPQHVSLFLQFDEGNMWITFTADEFSVSRFAPCGDERLRKIVEDLAKSCEILSV